MTRPNMVQERWSLTAPRRFLSSFIIIYVRQ